MSLYKGVGGCCSESCSLGADVYRHHRSEEFVPRIAIAASAGPNMVVDASALLLEIDLALDRVRAAAQALLGLADTLEERRRTLINKQRLAVALDQRMQGAWETLPQHLPLSFRGEVFHVEKRRLLAHPESLLSRAVPLTAMRSRTSQPYFFDFRSASFRGIAGFLETGTLFYNDVDEYDLEITEDLIVYLRLPVKRKVWGYRSSVCLVGHSGPVFAATQLADGRLCSGSMDSTLKLWNVFSCECECTLGAHARAVTCVLQRGDGRVCAGSADGTISFWDLVDGARTSMLRSDSPVTCLLQLGDGRLVSGHKDGRLVRWGYDNDIGDDFCEPKTSPAVALAELSLGRFASAHHYDRYNQGTVSIWSAANFRLLRSIIVSGGFISMRAVTPDSLLISLDDAAMLCDTTDDFSLRLLLRYTATSSCPSIVLADSRLVSVQGHSVCIHEGHWDSPGAAATTIPCVLNVSFVLQLRDGRLCVASSTSRLQHSFAIWR